MQSQGYKNYKDITRYTLPWFVIQPKMMRAHFKTNIEEFYNKYAQEKNPRLISHILVSMENSDEPSVEELDKIAQVEAALKDTDFGEVAKQFSDDPGSAQENGSIGLVDEDNKDSYVPEFAEMAMLLEEGEVSGWVKTDYGWHLIKNEASTLETLKKSDDLYYRFSVFYSDILSKLLYSRAVDMGIDFFGNDALHKYIMEKMEVDEQ